MCEPDAKVVLALSALRARIDDLDTALVKLLNERAACALEIGEIKQAHAMRIYQPSREQEVIAHVTAMNEGPLRSAALRRLFERIIDETRRLERADDGSDHTVQDEGE